MGGQSQSRSASSSRREHDDHYKLLVVGESFSGKTQLIEQFTIPVDQCRANFIDSYSTIYSDTIRRRMVDELDGLPSIHRRTVELDGVLIQLSMWDIVPFGYKSQRPMFYRNAHGVLVLYNATVEETFRRVPSWIEEVHSLLSKNIPIVLVGTACDCIDEKVVEYERARDFADERGIPFFEVSAKDGTNVELAFVTLAAMVLDQQSCSAVTSEENMDES